MPQSWAIATTVGIRANLQTERGKETIARIASEAHDTYHRVAILCSEASWRRCHRQDIANHLWMTTDKIVERIRVDGSLEPHPTHLLDVREAPETSNVADAIPQPALPVHSYEGPGRCEWLHSHP